jgi:hypothetical protein
MTRIELQQQRPPTHPTVAFAVDTSSSSSSSSPSPEALIQVRSLLQTILKSEAKETKVSSTFDDDDISTSDTTCRSHNHNKDKDFPTQYHPRISVRQYYQYHVDTAHTILHLLLSSSSSSHENDSLNHIYKSPSPMKTFMNDTGIVRSESSPRECHHHHQYHHHDLPQCPSSIGHPFIPLLQDALHRAHIAVIILNAFVPMIPPPPTLLTRPESRNDDIDDTTQVEIPTINDKVDDINHYANYQQAVWILRKCFRKLLLQLPEEPEVAVDVGVIFVVDPIITNSTTSSSSLQSLPPSRHPVRNNPKADTIPTTTSCCSEPPTMIATTTTTTTTTDDATTNCDITATNTAPIIASKTSDDGHAPIQWETGKNRNPENPHPADSTTSKQPQQQHLNIYHSPYIDDNHITNKECSCEYNESMHYHHQKNNVPYHHTTVATASNTRARHHYPRFPLPFLLSRFTSPPPHPRQTLHKSSLWPERFQYTITIPNWIIASTIGWISQVVVETMVDVVTGSCGLSDSRSDSHSHPCDHNNNYRRWTALPNQLYYDTSSNTLYTTTTNNHDNINGSNKSMYWWYVSKLLLESITSLVLSTCLITTTGSTDPHITTRYTE